MLWKHIIQGDYPKAPLSDPIREISLLASLIILGLGFFNSITKYGSSKVSRV